MKLIGQQESYWCWAASAQMSMDLFSTQVRQCEQVNKRLGMTTCCNSPMPAACNSTGWPEFAKYGFGATKNTTEAPLTWNQLVEEIGCQKRPVAFSWKYVGGGGHMMVAYGYQVNAEGVRELFVHDPLPVFKGEQEVISYDAYVSTQFYTHWDDFYNIAR
jgi:hypothetical protein